MSQKKNEGILFSAEIRVVGSYTDRLLKTIIGSRVGHVICHTFVHIFKVYGTYRWVFV